MAYILGNSGDNTLNGTVFGDTLDGLAGDDSLYGSNGNDDLYGGADRDYLDGQLGDDELYGGDDNDVIVFSWEDDVVAGGDGDDWLVASPYSNAGNSVLPIVSGGNGVDTLNYEPFSDDLSERLIADLFTGLAVFQWQEEPGGPLQVFPTFMSGIENLTGSDGDDSLIGNSGDNELRGGDGGADTLIGGDGDDLLWDSYDDEDSDEFHGGLANDTIHSFGADDQIFGDAGDDTIWVQDPATAEIDGGLNIDTLQLHQTTASESGYTIGGGGNISGIEVLRFDVGLDDGLDIDLDASLGTSLDGGVLTVIGAEGDDTFDASRIDGGAAVVLEGGEGDDTFEAVTGGDFDDGDTFDGGDGADRIEFADYLMGANATAHLLGGGDSIVSVETFDLADAWNFVELAIPLANSSSTGKIKVNGGSGLDFIYGDRIGNADVSLILNGNGGDDDLRGGAGDDTLDGGEGANYLNGGGGDDTLIGTPIFDIGGADTYDGGAGIDTLDFEAAIAGIGGSGVSIGGGGSIESIEVINLYGAAGSVNSIRLDPNIGVTASLSTLAGGDPLRLVTVNGSHSNDTIDGGQFYTPAVVPLAGARIASPITPQVVLSLYGGFGNDVLEGGRGADRIDGSFGNDTASYSRSTAAVVIDLAADTASGGAAAGDTLEGIENLVGSSFNDALTGNAIANSLNGAAGDDAMYGGQGDDIYVAESTRDLVFETTAGAAGGLNDQVFSSANHTLSANVENLTITAVSGQVNGTGNTHANTIVGNTANSFIDGKEGNDLLTGGGGSDQFLFTTALNAVTNVDQITDFDVADDYLRIDDAVFTALSVGYLAAAAFHTGASATAADDRIIYNAATGNIYYDPDGLGGVAQTQFATLGAGLAFGNGDIYVF